MNIQRYTWPVIIAASLHGALFLGSRDPSINHVVTTPVLTDGLKPIPEEFIQIDRPDSEKSTEVVPLKGGAAAPELPDIISVSLEKTALTIPLVEHLKVEKYADSLKTRGGLSDGLENGSALTMAKSIVGVGQLDRRPRATAQMSPDYPATMRQEKVAGSVTVEFDVDREGRVVRAEAIRYTRREFVEPALRAVRNWHFEPGKRNGAAVPFRMAVPIEFSIDDI